MLEFHERITAAGQFRSVLVSDELKATGSTCVVFETTPTHSGRKVFARKTCNGSPGSTRYEHFYELDEAYSTARAWAKRKINAHQRDQRLKATLILVSFARLLATGSPWRQR